MPIEYFSANERHLLDERLGRNIVSKCRHTAWILWGIGFLYSENHKIKNQVAKQFVQNFCGRYIFRYSAA